MTAGEDEPEPIIGNRLGIGHVRGSVAGAQRGLVRDRVGVRLDPPGVTEAVEGAPPRRREEPGARTIGQSGGGPAIERLRERLLDDFLRRVDVAHEAQHGRDHARVLQAERLRDARLDVAVGRRPGDRSHGQRCYPMPAPASPLGRAFRHIGQIGNTSM